MSYPDRPGDDLVIFGGHIVLAVVGYAAIGWSIVLTMVVFYAVGSLLNIYARKP